MHTAFFVLDKLVEVKIKENFQLYLKNYSNFLFYSYSLSSYLLAT